MSHDFKQLMVRKETPALWRVTFNNGPINLVDYETFRELDKAVAELESSPDVRVVIFDSAIRDFFLAHWDVAAQRKGDAPESEPTWTDISLRLANAHFVSIALIRGRARGIGNEIALGFDMRFASIEHAVLGQPEVGVGLIPGGGSIERLSLLVGRARALEVVLGAEDYDAQTAERYGWVNRALPDDKLDEFVLDFARRLASFDSEPLVEAKRLLSRHGVPATEDLQGSLMAFRGSFAWPGTQARAKVLASLGFGKPSDLEANFGEYLPRLKAQLHAG